MSAGHADRTLDLDELFSRWDAFLDHGTVARTVDADPAAAAATLTALEAVGVDLDDVAEVLEEQGVAAFAKSFDELIGALDAKAAELGAS